MSESEVTQLLEMVKEMSGAIRVLVENQDQLMRQQNNDARAIGDLFKVADNHANILRQSQAALERLWAECGLPFDPPSPQAN
jgi:hypothetical protein